MTEKQVRTLLEKQHHSAFHWARQCCRFDEELSKEVLQTVYLKILEGKATWSGKASFRTWLFSVIRYTAMDQFRQPEMYLSSIDEKMATEPATEDQTDYRFVIQQLPARQAEVLLLAFYHDLTLEQVAEVTNLTVGTVRTHYDRGKKGLRKLLNRENISHG